MAFQRENCKGRNKTISIFKFRFRRVLFAVALALVVSALLNSTPAQADNATQEELAWQQILSIGRFAHIQVPLDSNEQDTIKFRYLVLRTDNIEMAGRRSTKFVFECPGIKPMTLLLSKNFTSQGPHLLRAQIPKFDGRGPVYLTIISGSLDTTSGVVRRQRFRLMENYPSRNPAIHDLRFVEDE